MVKIREEHIEEIKYPHNTKKDDIVNQINCHFNNNKHNTRIINRIHNDDDDNSKNVNLIAII